MSALLMVARRVSWEGRSSRRIGGSRAGAPETGLRTSPYQAGALTRGAGARLVVVVATAVLASAGEGGPR